MGLMHALGEAFTGEYMLTTWLILFLASGLIAGVVSGWFKARKIQPRRFKWKIFGQEVLVAVVTLAIAGPILGFGQGWLKSDGYITFNNGPASWWVIALEYAAYFIGFDTYFYWLHRWMHKEPVYTWVHKLHHHSTAPNLLTTLSVNPLESLINGGFMPLFLAAFSVHPESLALMGPTTILMGFYVHSGYEFFPRWWNRSWATKWFITATFHDQHHKYFTANFGGYTTAWDRICGTMRPKFEADFANPKGRHLAKAPVGEPAAA
jgi:sterol desaturase/sphingolipid hydroxylase (fatty acid hydroxylase superfamily)